MSAIIGAGVSLRGIYFEDFQLPFNLAAGITKDDEGKAVTLDTSAPNTVKLAGDSDVVIGRLEVVEDRSVEGVLVGTVAVKFAARLPATANGAHNFAVGDTAIGSSTTAGSVMPRLNAGATAKESDYNDNMVVEVAGDGSWVVVVKA